MIEILLWIMMIEAGCIVVQAIVILRRDKTIRRLWEDIEETERQAGWEGYD